MFAPICLSVALISGVAALDLGLPPSSIGSSAAGAAPAVAPAKPTLPVSPVPAGRAKTLPGDVVGELATLRTADSSTYLTKSGARLVTEYPAPINYRAANGQFQPIDDTATQDTTGWHNAAGPYSASVPSTLAGQAVTVGSGSSSVAVTFLGAQSTAGAALSVGASPGTASGDTVAFTAPVADTNVSEEFLNTGVKETLSLMSPSAPSVFSWRLDPSAGLTPTLEPDGSVAFVDASGTTELEIPTPSIEDANDVLGPGPSFSLSSDGQVLTLSTAPDAAWLGDPARSYPVAVDPSVFYEGLSSGTNSECELLSNVPNTPECESASDYAVGWNSLGGTVHSLFRFASLTTDVPYDSLVQQANFEVYEDGGPGYDIPIVLNSVENRAWSSTTATWNDYNGGESEAWTTPGGDDTATPQVANVEAGAANGWLSWQPINQVQAWVNGEDLADVGAQAANEGFLLDSTSDSAEISIANWQSSSSTYWPSLSVTYVPRTGTASPLDILKTQLDDKLTLGVNVANGNLTLDNSDFSINGVGLSATVDHVYNSLGASSSSLGTYTSGAGSWSLSPSSDQPYLQVTTNNPTVVDLDADDGTNATFVASGSGFLQPPAVNATLRSVSGGYQLMFHGSNEVWTFHQDPADSSQYLLATDADRNGNTLSYTYNSSGQLTQIEDTEGRDIAVDYSGGVVSSVTDWTSRSASFNYTSGVLTSVGCGGDTTSFGYDSSGNLDQITDPLGNITTLSYDASHRVTAVTRVTDTSTMTGPTTSYAYYPGSASSPSSGYTVVTDPDDHNTTYDYDPWDQVTKVTDALGHTQSTSYDANSDPSSSTDDLSDVTSFAHDLNNNLTAITEPATTSGNTPAETQLGYSTGSGITGGTYLPSSETDPQNECTAYTYDSAGNLTDSYANQTGNCSGSTGGSAETQRLYYGDSGATHTTCPNAKNGELCSYTDADGNTTTYQYYSDGDLEWIIPPSPASVTEFDTYDALSRPTEISSYAGTLTIHYDAWDRITEIDSNGDPSSVVYTYDKDGNLTERQDTYGGTTQTYHYYYDALNRLTTIDDSNSSGYDCSGASPAGMTLTYDAASNVTAYCNANGTTTYGYDAANELTSLAEPGGSCTGTISLCTTFGYNGNGLRKTTTFPGDATENVTYDNASNITSVIGRDDTGTAHTSYVYKYQTAAAPTTDTSLVQKMVEDDHLTDVSVTYGYDGQERLTSAATAGGSTIDYSYDAAGNRCSDTTSCSSPTYTYNAASELTSGPLGSYTYFGTGGLESSPTLDNLNYSNDGQTVNATPAGESQEPLEYDDINQKVLTTDGGVQLVPGPFGQNAASTYDGTTTYYILDPEGDVLGEQVGSSHYYYFKDKNGSVTDVVTGAGTSWGDWYVYDPYGQVTSEGSNGVSNNYGFDGGWTDGYTGLTHFGDRWYDDTTGRWTQPDPNGGYVYDPSQSSNNAAGGYAFADDNPVNAVDPTGDLSWSDLTSAVLGGISGAFGGEFVGPLAGAIGGCISGLVGVALNGGDLASACLDGAEVGSITATVTSIATAILGIFGGD